MKQHYKRLTVALLVTLVIIGFGVEQAGASVQFRGSRHFALPYDVMSYGGSTMSSPHFAIRGTVGQNGTGPGASTNFRIGSGYWYSAEETYYRVYLPVGMRFSSP